MLGSQPCFCHVAVGVAVSLIRFASHYVLAHHVGRCDEMSDRRFEYAGHEHVKEEQVDG